MIIVQILPVQLHPGIGTHPFAASSPLRRIQHIFCSDSQLSQFSFFSLHQVAITAWWTEAAWGEKFARHFLKWLPVGIKSQTF